MFKFIHCADFHLDSVFAGLSANKVAARRKELKECFERVISLCQEKSVDALFIAGDLFDNTAASLSTIQFLDMQFSKIPDVDVFIAAGNHDPYLDDSFYKLYSFSDNVHIFGPEIEHVDCRGVDIYGVSLSDKYVADGLLDGFLSDGGIMVMHGSLGTTDEYNPITNKQIEQSNLTYLALGHIHAYSDILSQGKTKYAYSGAPEGRGFDETGKKGVIFGTLDGLTLTTEFIPTQKRCYHHAEIDVTGTASIQEIAEKVFSKNEIKEGDIIKLTLTGVPGCFINTQLLKTILEDKLFEVRVIDNTHEQIDKAIGLSAQFIKALGDDEISRKALKFGLTALSKKEIMLYED